MAAPRPHNWDGLRLRWLLLWAWCMLLAFLLFLARTGARRKAAVLTNLAAALLFSLALAACGGGGSSSPVPGTGTPAGTYSLTVTATAQSLSHSIQIALQVN